ncbi:hypothetical protein ACNSOL_11965 (plasmid) [Aliarcobacter lanthieri]|uniref:hypothetical protein n=1 Tax=Aliarcobacter lanthieri TaxID=1355374 RepID=UPI003AAC38F6
MKENKLLVLAGLLFFLLPSLVFGADDDFVVPFMELIITWMKGNVGLTIAIIIMVFAVIWGAFGGGFGIIGKGFILSILVGSVVWLAEKGFDIGTSFDSFNRIIPTLQTFS